MQRFHQITCVVLATAAAAMFLACDPSIDDPGVEDLSDGGSPVPDAGELPDAIGVSDSGNDAENDAGVSDAQAADASEAAAQPFVTGVFRGSYSESIYVVYSDGRLKAFGDNADGALGLESSDIARGYTGGQMGAKLPFVDLGAGNTVRSVAVSATTACALLTSGAVKCWGGNSYGQLGRGDQISRGENKGDMGDKLPNVDLGTGRTAVALSAGTGFNCALLDNGKVKCWGLNDSGQLGIGDPYNRGDDANEMGDKLPPVEFGTGRTAKAISSSYASSCALLDDNTVKCWGSNYFGQLGIGDGTNRGDAANQMGDDLPAVKVGSGRSAVQVSCGSSRVCVRLDDGSTKCWGYGAEGALGGGNKQSIGSAAIEMGNNLNPVSLGTGRTAAKLGDGDASSCVILDNGSVKCWGNGELGQLGRDDGSVENRGDDPNEMGDDLKAVNLGTGRTAVQLAGGYHSWCALLDDHGVKCWGNAGHGLGYGNTQSIGDGPNEMGDQLPEIDLSR